MPRPFALAVAFAMGVAVGSLLGLGLAAWAGLVALAALGLRGAGRVAALVALGGALWAAVGERRDDRALAGLAAAHGLDDREPDRIVGVVRGAIEESPDGWRLAVDAGEAVVEVALRGDPAERCGEAACGVVDLLPGDRVAVEGLLFSPRGFRVPGAPDEARRTRARGVHAALAADWFRIERLARGGPSPSRAAAGARRALAARLGGGEGDLEAGLLRGLVLGVRAGIAPPTAEAWRDAGMSHLLAVSGMHLAAVALLAFAALRRLFAALPRGPVDPARPAAALAAPLAIAYTLVTGAPASAVRAAIALLVVFVGVLLGRRSGALDALGVALLAILIDRPAALFDPSLQLSCAATAALALAAIAGRRAAEAIEVEAAPVGRARRAASWIERRCWAGLAASLAAALATAPLTALHFGAVQPAGGVANLVAAPLTEAIALPLGLLAALLGAAGAPLAAVAGAALGLADRVAVAVAAAVPPVWTGPPTAVELALIAVGLLGVVGLALGGAARRPGAATAAVAAIGLTISWFATTAVVPRLTRATRVHVVDVGQGDAALVEAPGGGAWLIDGGGRPFVAGASSEARRRRSEERPGEAVVALLGARRVRRIDLVVLSHAHPDHYLGLRAIARRVPIDELWLALPSDGQRLPPDLAALLGELAAGGTRIVHPPLGVARERGGARLRVLWPRGPDPAERRAAGDPVLSVNDASLVVRLEAGGRRVLFAGDLEAEGEALLAAAVPDLGADVVKVAHHGSATSSTAAFVAATRPGLALISCGVANRFGFPAPAVVERWQAAGAEVLRTDRRGTITLTLSPDGALDVATMD